MAGEDEAERTPPAAEQTDGSAEGPPAEPPAASPPGFGERGRMRRRARFLRKARELAYRDLGGLVYDLHRFGQRNDQVVLAKLATLGHIDAELRALEAALHEIKPVTVLHEVGIAACPRCAAIHGHEDRFCPGCGLAFAAGADRPLSTAPVTATAPAAQTATASTDQAPAATGAVEQPAPSETATASNPPAAPAPRPAGEPLTTIERPPAPALKPTAAPVAARPATPTAASEGNARGESSEGEREADPEQQPTQILRPPAGGA